MKLGALAAAPEVVSTGAHAVGAVDCVTGMRRGVVSFG